MEGGGECLSPAQLLPCGPASLSNIPYFTQRIAPFFFTASVSLTVDCLREAKR